MSMKSTLDLLGTGVAKPRSAVGRPKKPWQFDLEFVVVEIHERLRMEGVGRNLAIEETVNECRKRHPSASISTTKVKEVLAKLQPESGIQFPRIKEVHLQGVLCGLVKLDDPFDLVDGVFRVVADGDKHVISFDSRPSFGQRGKRLTTGKRKKTGTWP